MKSNHNEFYKIYFKTPKLAFKAMLMSIRELKGGYDKYGGICVNIDDRYFRNIAKLRKIPAFNKYCGSHHVYSALLDSLDHIMSSWPNGTGSSAYPVPDPAAGNACEAYCEAHEKGTLWVGEYGDKRKELLKFVIECYSRFENRVYNTMK